MANAGTGPDVAENAPEVDLFAGESDYEDDVYRANAITGDDTLPNVDVSAPKPAKKGCILNLENFWHNTSDLLQVAPRTRKNILWDFMVFHNLREEREGRYISYVQQLETEITLAIKKAKVAILSDVSEGSHAGVFVNDVAMAFDYHVTKLVNRFRVHSTDGTPLFARAGEEIHEAGKNVTIEGYLRSNEEFSKLKNKLSNFRMAKNRLVTASLTRILSSVDGMRSKVVSDVYEPNSREFKRMTLTRFLRNMDKITNRAEFSGEYRFDLLRTFIMNKEDLETFIQHNTTFAGDSPDANHFEDFTNQFTPDYGVSDIVRDHGTTDFGPSVDTSPYATVGDDRARNPMEDFMNATPPDDILTSPSQHCAVEVPNQDDEPFRIHVMKSTTEDTSPRDAPMSQSTDNLNTEDDEDAQMKLLEEARKKAAEILRLKRLNRVNTEAHPAAE